MLFLVPSQIRPKLIAKLIQLVNFVYCPSSLRYNESCNQKMKTYKDNSNKILKYLEIEFLLTYWM